MKGFFDLEEVSVSRDVLFDTTISLRAAGAKGNEGIVLWAGRRKEVSFNTLKAIIPAQTPIRTPYGISARVEPAELHRVNVWLSEARMQLIAQVHSHPTDAYHSELDDIGAMVMTAGSLSLVVPDFAAQPFSLARCAVYRLQETAEWAPMDSAAVAKLFSITD